MRWRLRDGLRLGTPITQRFITSICSTRPRPTKLHRSGSRHLMASRWFAALLAGRDIQVHTTDVAETQAKYLRAGRASSPRNRWISTPCPRRRAGEDTSTALNRDDAQTISNIARIRTAEST